MRIAFDLTGLVFGYPLFQVIGVSCVVRVIGAT